MKVLRTAALAAIMAGAAVSLASPASADDLLGMYRATATAGDGETSTVSWMLSACGPDCRTLMWGQSVEEMHRVGTVWSSTDSNGCTTVMDENTLAGTFQCPGKDLMPVQAVRA